MKHLFVSFYSTVRAIMCMWCLETQVPLHEQGGCCEQRPAALKHRSPVQPDSQLGAALPCQATPQPAGGNLQLQHLSRINSSALTLNASRCVRERCRGSLIPVDKVWLMSKERKVVLLIYWGADYSVKMSSILSTKTTRKQPISYHCSSYKRYTVCAEYPVDVLTSYFPILT